MKSSGFHLRWLASIANDTFSETKDTERSDEDRTYYPDIMKLRPPRKRVAGNEDTKGARRMPWHRKSTKDAASCDNLRGGAITRRSGGLRMGEPTRGHARVSPPESIGRERTTGGTETSKYPEEEKSTEIPRVAASESGSAQTHVRVSAGRCHVGVAGAITA